MKHNTALHWFAVVTAAATFCLVIAGGLVTSTQSGLSVPDWPLSYGQLMPPMVGGIFYEHGHRMAATFVGLLTVILAIWLWRGEDRKWMKALGFTALAVIIAQGVLGGLTVLFLLPTPISVSHATLAQTFFALMASIALFTSHWWRTDVHRLEEHDAKPHFFSLAMITTLAVYIQLILGALMRHTHSGLAVPDFPLAYGQIFPSLSPEMIDKYNEQLIQSNVLLFGDGPIDGSQILIHMVHRGWALVVSAMVIWTTIRIFRTPDAPDKIKRFGLILPVLLIAQITLGAFTVLTQKSVAVTTAHVATGALMLVSCLLLVLHVWKIYGAGVEERVLAVHAKEMTA